MEKDYEERDYPKYTGLVDAISRKYIFKVHNLPIFHLAWCKLRNSKPNAHPTDLNGHMIPL